MNLDDVEDGDLVYVDDERNEVEEKVCRMIAMWNS
ncbi:replication domain protein [Viridibacillus arvi]